jgi:major vault protein
MSDNNTRARERDLILAPNEFAYILDETKGNVINYVGPHKTSLANTDQPVIFNHKSKQFERCNLEQATKNFAIAPEGWYLVLKNPAHDGHPPKTGTANNLPELNIGRKINMPGPVSFAPWPGQMTQVIQGHRLRSNQYLIVRVYDEEAARANWGKAVIKPQAHKDSDTPVPQHSERMVSVELPDLTMGKLLVIKGTEVSFYIPPTGIEVVPDEYAEYIRDAVTLEQLEYCILLDENGSKRYIRGPAVVFPQPTENFIEKNDARKFKAIELNEISGLYIKVIAAYEENGTHYKVGDELFITGKEQMIYFPRAEHAIVRYGENEIIYAVAIPAGEARYVLDRLSGQIMLKRGPSMYLADPRKEVIVRRVIEPKQVALWFPGNQEALEYNAKLMALTRGKKDEFVSDNDVRLSAAKPLAMERGAVSEGFAGDEFQRGKKFTPPRTITLDTKYEGAIAINVWTGYAVLVVSKSGERKVFAGPGTYLLEYDEILEAIEFSTGTPKSDKRLEKSVYLRILHNKISDIVEAETKDLCQVRIQLSYRVNFEGTSEHWFGVENYVKFLCDHMRSLLRHAVKCYGVEPFYADAIRIVRDTVLGTSDEAHSRPGRIFSENGMRIYDVEILNVSIEDNNIATLLTQAQHTDVKQALELNAAHKNLNEAREKEDIKRQLAQAQHLTQTLLLQLQIKEVQERLKLNLSELEARAAAQSKNLEANLAEQVLLGHISTAELERKKSAHELEIEVSRQQLALHLEQLRTEVQAVVDKAHAVSPHLIATLQSFSDRALAERVAQNMAPLAILGGNSVADVFAQLLKGTVLEKALLPQEKR